MRNGHLMASRRISSSQSFDGKIFEPLDDSWRTVGEIRRLLGGGEAFDVAMALDRLWKAGRIEKDDAHIIVGAGRKGGGGKLSLSQMQAEAGSRRNARPPRQIELVSLPNSDALREETLRVLDHILKFMTLGTVIVGSIAIYAALHTNNRRLGADIFLRYSDRISDLRRHLPITAFFERDAFGKTEITPQERRAAHEIIYSIFELYELKVHGFLPSAIWKIREPDIERLLSLPLFRQELTALQDRFVRHPRFAVWLEKIRRRET
jgi:hypothetical protein